MVEVRFTDRDTIEHWENYKIIESGDWVALWDEHQRDTVPKECISYIEDHGEYSGLPKTKADGGLPTDWPVRRQQVVVRDGFLCQNCWKFGGEMGPKKLEVHHIVPRGVPEMTHRLTNLVTLCKECHDVIPTV